MRSTRSAAALLVVAIAITAFAATGCDRGGTEAALTPKVKPPVIGKAGILRAAIDLTYPPYGGTVGGVKAGLDVDVASALADRLGLKLQIVDAKPEAGAVMLRDGKVDVLIAGVPIDRAVQLDVAFAGSYINDGPALYSNTEATPTIDGLQGKRIAVQKESAAFWLLAEELGEDLLVVTPTLREALSTVASGTVDFVAGDGVVAAYLLRDFPKLRFNGQLAPAVPVGVAVARDRAELEQAVRAALDELSSQGVLETLRRKWMGELPRLSGASETSSSIEGTTQP
ncbi:MAG: transporter substrate-binding domain-containing protein [Coriobacteriia bacterium]|nr:transporter substrate-binding domain-containing protein [Coriobacteriia bacterium]